MKMNCKQYCGHFFNHTVILYTYVTCYVDLGQLWHYAGVDLFIFFVIPSQYVIDILVKSRNKDKKEKEQIRYTCSLNLKRSIRLMTRNPNRFLCCQISWKGEKWVLIFVFSLKCRDNDNKMKVHESRFRFTNKKSYTTHYF